MGKTIHEIIKEMLPLLSYGQHGGSLSEKSAQSKTSLCALLFNGGCLIYSDMLETFGGEAPWKSSTRERKIYKVGDDDILLAGTGSSAGIMAAAQKTSQIIAYWRSQNELEPIPPKMVGQILSKIMTPGDEAKFLLGGYDYHSEQGIIATISENGCLSQSHLFQINGSGSRYMASKAHALEEKVLRITKQKVVVTQDIYTVLPSLLFSKETAMLEGLDIITSGPENDVFSGGEGYQLTVLNKNGVEEYIIPREIAQGILDRKREAEHSSINPQIEHKQFLDYASLFEQCKRPTDRWWIQ